MTLLFDSHCHLTDERFRDDLDQVVANAAAAGVHRMVTISSTPDDAEAALAIADRFDNVWATAGVHPHAVAEVGRDAMSRVADLADDPRIVALGETGLDYHYDNSPRSMQRAALRRHVELSADLALEAGWMISFSGLVTFKNYEGDGLVRDVPPDQLMIETDSPYLAPVPNRGKRNEPAWVKHVAEALARMRGETVEDVSANTFRNATRFYGLPMLASV